MRGGGYLMEHPADPGVPPYPSMWQIPDLIEMEARVGARRVHFDQCPFGGISPKATTFSGTLDGMEEIDNIRCPGISSTHQHGKSIGLAPDGTLLHSAFADLSKRFSVGTLPKCCFAPFAVWKSRTVVQQELSQLYKKFQHRGLLLGLFGPIQKDKESFFSMKLRRGARVCWWMKSRRRPMSMLMTRFLCQMPTIECCTADKLMKEAVVGLEAIGFQVSQQVCSGELEKVVGYEVVNKPAQFRYPLNKAAQLQIALRGLAGQKMVAVNTLRSLVGMWIFGSLLKRELLSIPHAVFHFMDEFEDMVVPWWESARQEVKAMANLMSQMFCHVGSPISQWLFATDAMGQNEIDYGGFGIAQRSRRLLQQGEISGKSIARLNGFQGAKFPNRAMVPHSSFFTSSDGVF